MISAQEVAKYFLYLAEANDDQEMSNLRLQKLLYYAQGIHLALYDKVLFPERIMKWAHGPVVPEVYHRYKKYGYDPIAFIGVDVEEFSPEAREVMEEVYTVYGQFSASALRNMTHREPPWLEAEDNGALTLRSMKDYFKTRLIDDTEED